MTTASLTFFFSLSVLTIWWTTRRDLNCLSVALTFCLFGGLYCVYIPSLCVVAHQVKETLSGGGWMRKMKQINTRPCGKKKTLYFFPVVFLLRDIIFGVAHRYYYHSCPNPVACCVNCVHGNSTSMLLTTTATLILLLRAPAALLSLRRLLFSLFLFFVFVFVLFSNNRIENWES
jgi:hypothetical protein